MNPVEIIAIKRDGGELTTGQIRDFVRAVCDGSMKDYQVSALLMAIYLNGMSARETVDLTMAMARSGDMLDLSAIEGIKVDKHSTGGVGDATTLVLAPLVAACGVKVAKISGRGLGHTGGTLDKLEAIAGLSIDLSSERFIDQVNRVGLAVIGQTGSIAPADKALYALRDVTATVESLPLVVSSILSKKLASGADVVVLDVKAGSGSIMPTLDKSIELAHTMVDIGNRAGRKFSALVTDMDQPLGLYVGNALEVEEAIHVLSGRARGPLRELSVQLGAHMLLDSGRVDSLEAGERLLAEKIDSGEGLDKFAEMIEAQGGDGRVTRDVGRLPQAKEAQSVCAQRSGYVSRIYTDAVGNAARALGAGRMRKEDAIDPAAGLIMRARVGDFVKKGQEMCELRLGPISRVDAARALLDAAFEFSETPVTPPPLVHAVISGRGSA